MCVRILFGFGQRNGPVKTSLEVTTQSSAVPFDCAPGSPAKAGGKVQMEPSPFRDDSDRAISRYCVSRRRILAAMV